MIEITGLSKWREVCEENRLSPSSAAVLVLALAGFLWWGIIEGVQALLSYLS